jgi:hypothetical protein
MRDTKDLSRSLVKPLRDAFEASRMKLDDLIARAGLDITRVSMSRKLSGGQGIGIPAEAEKLGKVFGLTLTWTGKAFRYEKQAA